MKLSHIVLPCLSVLLPVRVIQLKNFWADLDEIWYGRYVIGVCSITFIVMGWYRIRLPMH
jgi:hypothetical protein